MSGDLALKYGFKQLITWIVTNIYIYKWSWFMKSELFTLGSHTYLTMKLENQTTDKVFLSVSGE